MENTPSMSDRNNFLGVGYIVRVYPQHLGGFITGLALFLWWKFFHHSSANIVILCGSSAERRRFRELLFQPYRKTRFLTLIEIPSPQLIGDDPGKGRFSIVTVPRVDGLKCDA